MGVAHAVWAAPAMLPVLGKGWWAWHHTCLEAGPPSWTNTRLDCRDKLSVGGRQTLNRPESDMLKQQQCGEEPVRGADSGWLHLHFMRQLGSSLLGPLHVSLAAHNACRRAHEALEGLAPVCHPGLQSSRQLPCRCAACMQSAEFSQAHPLQSVSETLLIHTFTHCIMLPTHCIMLPIQYYHAPLKHLT